MLRFRHAPISLFVRLTNGLHCHGITNGLVLMLMMDHYQRRIRCPLSHHCTAHWAETTYAISFIQCYTGSAMTIFLIQAPITGLSGNNIAGMGCPSPVILAIRICTLEWISGG